MATSAGIKQGEPMLEINTTPLIDVMLVLLIMFIITLPIMTHSISLEMPRVVGPSTPADVIDLEVDFDGTLLANGALIGGYEQLETYFAAAAHRNPQPELHVRPDRRANYDTVAHVLGIAQRNGIKRIGFAGNEKFVD
jgi:biopolymer transport protein ExbD